MRETVIANLPWLQLLDRSEKLWAMLYIDALIRNTLMKAKKFNNLENKILWRGQLDQ